MHEESALLRHMRREMALFRKANPDQDGLDKAFTDMIFKNVEQLMEVLAEQGHSGGSIVETLELLHRMAHHGILTPLAGDVEEWQHVGIENDNRPMYQNKRYYSVFKMGQGAPPYMIDAILFVLPNGETAKYASFIHNGKVHQVRNYQFIPAFPFQPHQFRVQVAEQQNGDGLIINFDEIKQVIGYFGPQNTPANVAKDQFIEDWLNFQEEGYKSIQIDIENG